MLAKPLLTTALYLCFAAPAAADLTPEQQLGQRLYQDVNLSASRNQSCASCHSLKKIAGKAPAFVDPANVKQGTPVSLGSIEFATGTLNAPSAAYAGFSPPFHWEAKDGTYEGGQFWNGRANDLAEQAQKPLLNPVEMAMPNEWAVVSRLKADPAYIRLFYKLYQLDLAAVPDIKDAQFQQQAPQAVADIYQKLAQAIAAFEMSPAFHKFNAKFDFVLAGQTHFTALEEQGRKLFDGKAGCSGCHISSMGTDAQGHPQPPLFTDFTYDNIGLPRNFKIPGQPKPNLGLGERSDIRQSDPDKLEWGKHKVMSLRNIAITPPYGHNGVFATLEQITHFYNTRDVLGQVANNLSPDFGVSGWPKPEVLKNVNHDELGNLGLTPAQEQAVVAFMKTLTDDYPEWGNDPLVPPGTPSPFAGRP
ncbi:cytochrome-c peroxidase [Methylovulum psychrotolerans]|uniref:Methylamine utilization protein MauG n=1 Tax=Methylovulum psychrotolerans TaxID=1704499 RepID=A0A2S5CSP6_9GAMM|nr:cytochrome c peroxidase [Methylovulum psychrotolerans]POZ53834.1 methylamine utilization protein MauG [Methylovulum psychrotolerans]